MDRETRVEMVWKQDIARTEYAMNKEVLPTPLSPTSTPLTNWFMGRHAIQPITKIKAALVAKKRIDFILRRTHGYKLYRCRTKSKIGEPGSSACDEAVRRVSPKKMKSDRTFFFPAADEIFRAPLATHSELKRAYINIHKEIRD